jgi:hypothetical protein
MHTSTLLIMDTHKHSKTPQQIDADSLTGIHSAMVKYLFVVNRSCIHRGLYVSPQVKTQRVQIW